MNREQKEGFPSTQEKLPSFLQNHPDGATVSVSVQPKARRTEVVGVQHGELRIKLCAPPVEGAANRECLRFLADLTGTAKSRVRLLYGDKSRKKVILIQGTNAERLVEIFEALGYGEERPSPTSNGS